MKSSKEFSDQIFIRYFYAREIIKKTLDIEISATLFMIAKSLIYSELMLISDKLISKELD